MGYPSQPESYRKTQIDTASPEMLILMLYDGALRFTASAEEAFENRNIESISNSLLRVQAIITELLTCLDKDRGGEIALNLERIYLFFLEKLADSNVNKNVKPLQEIKPLLENLRDTWAELVKTRAKNPSQPSSPQRLNIAV